MKWLTMRDGSLSLRERVGERGIELFGCPLPLPVPLPVGEGTEKFACYSISKVAPRIFALLFATIVLTACGNGVEVADLGKLEKPAEHDQMPPSAQAPVERQVVVPDEVKKKFAAVTLMMKRRADAREIRVTQALGTSRTIEGITLTVRDYLPAFVMQAATITSESSEESNPAVWIEAREGDTQLYSGWLFRDYPELTPPLDAHFEIRLIEAVPQK